MVTRTSVHAPADPDSCVIACASCSQDMDLDAPRRGEAFECPHCGAVNVYLPKPSAPTRDEHSENDEYPAADGPELDVLCIRPSIARSSPLLWSLVWLLFLTGVAGLVWLFMRQRPAWMLAFPGAACLGAGVTLLTWKLRCMSSEVRITTKRIIDRDGLLSQRVTEVLHRDIKRIDMRQTLWQRLFDVGELSICADSEEGPEVFMTHMPHPRRVRDVLDRYRTL